MNDKIKKRAISVLSLGDEHGAELYYNVAVTSWRQITPDLQVISPFCDPVDTSLMLGMRVKNDF